MDTLQKMSASPRRRGLTDSHSRLQLWLPLADPSQKAGATDSDHETSAQVKREEKTESGGRAAWRHPAPQYGLQGIRQDPAASPRKGFSQTGCRGGDGALSYPSSQ